MTKGSHPSSGCCIFSSAFVRQTPAKAQDSFYKGKTVRIIVGASAGGGYDTYFAHDSPAHG